MPRRSVLKKKNIVLAVIATAAMALSLVGCGVKVTNISLPDAATLEKGESITLPVNFGTEDAPAETPVIATGEAKMGTVPKLRS